MKYKDIIFPRRFRADLVVEEKILIENKAITAMTSSDEAQLFYYLKTTGLRVGLLFNFGASKLEKIRRILWLKLGVNRCAIRGDALREHNCRKT